MLGEVGEGEISSDTIRGGVSSWELSVVSIVGKVVGLLLQDVISKAQIESRIIRR